MSSAHYFETKYLIDETPATSLQNEWIKTEFFQKNCYIPDEIIYELRDNYERLIVKVNATTTEKMQQLQ